MCFPQKSERAVFEGAVHEIVMRRNKDDDNIRVQLIQLLCQIESGFCRHIDVKEQNVDGVMYDGYNQYRDAVYGLESELNKMGVQVVPCHCDTLPENWLKESSGKIWLLDWEYSGMQDPHVDIAMFCIYSLYDRKQIDKLIDLYFEDSCLWENRLKVYCYVACCGLLWSNWCEYKRQLGVDFGEYSLRQYRYAKEYYRIVQEELKKMEAFDGCIR